MLNCAIIPAYNEEKNIKEVILKIKNLKKFKKVIVVDDGSKDRTAEIAESLSVIVLRHIRNKGKGEAIKTAFKKVKKMKDVENIVLIDADMQFDPKESLKIIKALDNYDLVMGKRNWKKIPFRHRLGNFVWRTTFNFLFNQNLKDTNCGLIGIKSKNLGKINVQGGYIIENSILASAVRNHLKIGQVDVNVDYHKVSKVGRGVRMVLGVLYFIIKEGLNYRFNHI